MSLLLFCMLSTPLSPQNWWSLPSWAFCNCVFSVRRGLKRVVLLQELLMVYAILRQSCGSQCVSLPAAFDTPEFDPHQMQLPVLQTHQVRTISQPFQISVWALSALDGAMVCTILLVFGLAAFRFNFVPPLPASSLPASHDLMWRGQDQDNLLSH